MKSNLKSHRTVLLCTTGVALTILAIALVFSGRTREILWALLPFEAPPLHLAAAEGDLDQLVDELMRHPEQLDQASSIFRMDTGTLFTPLMWAARGSHIECMSVLINAGADVEASNPVGLTALSMAASTGDSDTVQVLLDNGADPNQETRSMDKALAYAIRSDSLECVQALISHGANTLDPLCPAYVIVVESGSVKMLDFFRDDYISLGDSELQRVITIASRRIDEQGVRIHQILMKIRSERMPSSPGPNSN